MPNRGKKGLPGEKIWQWCKKCKKKTWHIFTQDNPGSKFWWECQKCHTKIPGRLNKKALFKD